MPIPDFIYLALGGHLLRHLTRTYLGYISIYSVYTDALKARVHIERNLTEGIESFKYVQSLYLG